MKMSASERYARSKVVQRKKDRGRMLKSPVLFAVAYKKEVNMKHSRNGNAEALFFICPYKLGKHLM